MTIATQILLNARVAFYGRYSSDQQRDTSLDDQLRRCRELAARHGWLIPDELVFTDAGISGKGSETHRRTGYQAMLQAWKTGGFSVLIVDTQSRLFRDEMEALQLKQLIKRSGVNVLTCDGVDTSFSGWEMLFGIKSVVNAAELAVIGFNVRRGMEGALERGLAASKPPYGYRAIALPALGRNRKGGARWEIDPETSVVVQRIFAARLAGSTYGQIARDLNADSVPGRRGGTWLGSSVANLLQNTTYAGVLQFYKSSAKIHAENVRYAMPVHEYPRPELALVSAADWAAVQPAADATRFVPTTGKFSQSGRGGGVHWSAGLVRCGVCGSVLTTKQAAHGVSLFCAACARQTVAGIEGRAGGYVDVRAVESLFLFALPALLTPPVLALLRDAIREKLTSGSGAAIAQCTQRIEHYDAVLRRLSRALALADGDGSEFDADLSSARAGRRLAAAELLQLELGRPLLTADELDAQLSSDPLLALPALFSDSPPAELRSVLNRLFPTVVFHRVKPKCAEFSLTMSPGVAAAIASGTSALDVEPLPARFRVLSSSRAAVAPVVQLLGADDAVVSSNQAASRVCPKCGVEHPISEFGAGRGAERLLSYCRLCRNVYSAAYARAHPKNKTKISAAV